MMLLAEPAMPSFNWALWIDFALPILGGLLLAVCVPAYFWFKRTYRIRSSRGSDFSNSSPRHDDVR